MNYSIVVRTKEEISGRFDSQVCHVSSTEPEFNMNIGVVIVREEGRHGPGAYTAYPIINVLDITVRPIVNPVQA